MVSAPIGALFIIFFKVNARIIDGRYFIVVVVVAASINLRMNHVRRKVSARQELIN